jgi:DNA-binding PadR family transcriptional regulator
VLELAVLGLLKERAMHGYELRKQLSQKLGFFWTVSFGSLYPTLKKLERRGVVEKFSADQASRRKQVYRITPAGETEFLELLNEGAHSTWEEDKFPVRMAFFRYLGPESRVRLLERRKAFLEDKLDEGRRLLSRAARGRDDTYTVSLMRHGVESTQHDIDWLDQLIAAERATINDAGTDGSADADEPASAPVEDSPVESVPVSRTELQAK